MLAAARHRIEVQLVHGNIVNVRSHAYVFGVYDYVRPTGAASDVDELLGRKLSVLLQARMFGSRLGEVSLLPIPRYGSRADLVAFVGLGPISDFNPRFLEFVGANLARVLSAAGVASLATVPLGVSVQGGLSEFLKFFLEGVARGLEGSDPDHELKSVQICDLDHGRFEDLWRELQRLAGTDFFDKLGLDVAITRREVEPEPFGRAVGAGGTKRPLDPIYLMLTAEDTAAGLKFKFTVLTAGGDAVVIPEEKIVTHDERQAVNRKLQRARSIDAEIGRLIAETYLPPKFRQVIESKLCDPDHRRPLVVIHDDWGSVIPWEALHLGAHCPALLAGVSRRLLARRPEDAVARPSLLGNAKLRMLMIYDPTEDLSAARDEGQRLQKLLAGAGVEITILYEKDATCDRVIRELRDCDYDIVHYAGHADFEDGEPSESGLLCSDGRLVARDLPRSTMSPQLIFLNACESGRMRRKKVIGKELHADIEGHLNANASLAEAFITRGTGNFIGTYWPVDDVAALAFAETFYKQLLSGDIMADALRKARSVVKAANPADWANYMHFGDPNYRLREIRK